MYKVTIKILVLLMFSLLLEACTADTTVSVTIATTRVSLPTETAVVVTSIPTETVVVFTPTPSPALINIPIPEKPLPTPSTTSIPTSTPTPTPEPTLTTQPITLSSLNYVDLPAWVSDPSINVLLLRTDYNVTLFNPQTEERFDIPVDGYPSVRWAQSEEGLYIHVGYPIFSGDTSKKADEINVVSGEVNQIEMPLQITPEPPSFVSPNGRYKARITNGVVSLIDLAGGQEIELLSLVDNEYPSVSDVEWSLDSQMLAIERVRSVDDPEAFYGQRTISALTIYSTDGQSIGQYLDITGWSAKWSPEVPYRLIHPTIGMMDSPPCVIDINNDSYICIEQLISWREKQQVDTGNYKWLPDGNRLGFVYWSEFSGGGFCYIDLNSDEITCPVIATDLQDDVILDQFDPSYFFSSLFVTYYFWSPDSSYIALIVDPASPEEHNRAHEAVAVINSAGEQFQLIIDGWLKHDDYDPWRPSIIDSD